MAMVDFQLYQFPSSFGAFVFKMQMIFFPFLPANFELAAVFSIIDILKSKKTIQLYSLTDLKLYILGDSAH